MCAVKEAKIPEYFDALSECSCLQKLQGSPNFPFFFGLVGNAIVMELVLDENNETSTVYSTFKAGEKSQDFWNSTSMELTGAIMFMHSKGLLYNDIKSNNILLKGKHSIPIVIDMGKTTPRSKTLIYKLNDRQKTRYNTHHKYLAFELRNIYGAKTDTRTDTFSLGYLFENLIEGNNNLLGVLKTGMLIEDPDKILTLPYVFRQFKSWKKKKESV